MSPEDAAATPDEDDPAKCITRAPFARCKARNGRIERRAGCWLAFTMAIPSAAFARPISTSPHLLQVPESFTPSADTPSCHFPDISCRGSFLPESFRGGCSFGADTCRVGLFQRQCEPMIHSIRGQATPECATRIDADRNAGTPMHQQDETRCWRRTRTRHFISPVTALALRAQSKPSILLPCAIHPR
jgi:hypothetical protein